MKEGVLVDTNSVVKNRLINRKSGISQAPGMPEELACLDRTNSTEQFQRHFLIHNPNKDFLIRKTQKVNSETGIGGA